jgi:crotonobetainyl-CoA:carnitine CoA-transferase CaiB-like acyl-CoA transferase
MLADQGAEVVRVDPPGGPRWKSLAMEALNRRKRTILLDLKSDADLETAQRLIAAADVLIENFRPGVMARLGLGWEACDRTNPRLVYVSLPGFASTDPERAGLRAWESVIAAESGEFTDMGLNRILMGINPSFTPLPLASAYGALFAATAVGAALFARERSGRGEHIEVPLASAMMEGLVYNSMHIENYPDRYKSPREKEIERRHAAGEAFDLSFSELQDFLDPFYRSYFCADSRPIYVVSASHRGHVRRTLEVLGLLEEALAAGIPELEDWYLSTRDWPEGVDCALGLYPLSRRWADWLSEQMKTRFRDKTSFEWERLFDEAGVPAVAHRTTREWLNSEHALASGLVHELEHPERGRVRQAGPVAWLAGSAQLAASSAPTSAPDADRAEILAGLREDTPETSRGEVSGGWLDGVNILDMTNVIAGPTIASTLARFGAEVIKLDPVKPTFDPWNTIVFGLQAGRGKRSLLADITTEDGREILRKLVAWADVVTINALDRQLTPLGVDHESLKAINPDVILCQLDAFGGPRRGPRSDHAGYDDLAQAMTGIRARFGGGLETPEEHAHLGTIDVLAGIAGAFATGIALYKRARTGEPDIARSSLAAAGQLIQAPMMFDFEGRHPFDEPSGREARGYSALCRLYRTADDWIFLAAREQDAHAVGETVELANLEALTDSQRTVRLAERFLSGRAEDWIARLRRRDIGVGRVQSLKGLRESYSKNPPRGGTYRFDVFADHPSERAVTLFAPCAVRPGRSTITPPFPAEKYGTSTRDILHSLGYDEEAITSLIDRAVVSDSWSKVYLPD